MKGDGTVNAPLRAIPTVNAYWDDLLVGDRFVSRSRTVTETDIVNYSGLSGDYSSIHVDRVFAAGSPFNEPIAHGCLILSIATGLEFLSMCKSAEEYVVAFYGMDRVRFVKPVRAGDTIHVEGEVTDKSEKDETRGVITYHLEIFNQKGEVVAALDKKLLNRRRA